MGRKATITSVERIERQQRIAAIIQMRLQGCTLGCSARRGTPPWVSRRHSLQTIKKALEDMAREPFEEVRQLELMRLDELLVGVYGRAISGDVAYIDRALAISDRRVRLLGLKTWFTGSVPTQTLTRPPSGSRSSAARMSSASAIWRSNCAAAARRRTA